MGAGRGDGSIRSVEDKILYAKERNAGRRRVNGRDDATFERRMCGAGSRGGNSNNGPESVDVKADMRRASPADVAVGA